MSEYADGFDDGKGEKFDELMVEIVSLRLDFQNCEAKRVGAINSLREHINICNGLKIENAALRDQSKWLLHELKTAADRLTDCEQTTVSARDCIGRVEAAMKEEGK